ncbi:hypothetical protein MRX96_045720 [Rhipicephalus microplus]
MLREVHWERDRDFDLVRALEHRVNSAIDRDHPVFVSGVAEASVVDNCVEASSVEFINCRCSSSMAFLTEYLWQVLAGVAGTVDQYWHDHLKRILTVESTGVMALDN